MIMICARFAFLSSICNAHRTVLHRIARDRSTLPYRTVSYCKSCRTKCTAKPSTPSPGRHLRQPHLRPAHRHQAQAADWWACGASCSIAVRRHDTTISVCVNTRCVWSFPRLPPETIGIIPIKLPKSGADISKRSGPSWAVRRPSHFPQYNGF